MTILTKIYLSYVQAQLKNTIWPEYFPRGDVAALDRRMQITPTSEKLTTERADQNSCTVNPIKISQPPTERWSGEAVAGKHQPFLHKARPKFVQSRQFPSSSVKLTLLIGRMCDVVLLERLSWTAACLQRQHLKVIHWAEFLTSRLISLHYLKTDCDSLLWE